MKRKSIIAICLATVMLLGGITIALKLSTKDEVKNFDENAIVEGNDEVKTGNEDKEIAEEDLNTELEEVVEIKPTENIENQTESNSQKPTTEEPATPTIQEKPKPTPPPTQEKPKPTPPPTEEVKPTPPPTPSQPDSETPVGVPTGKGAVIYKYENLAIVRDDAKRRVRIFQWADGWWQEIASNGY